MERAWSSSGIDRSARTRTSTRSSSASTTMPETRVVKGAHGLPYSKGLMAQSLSASGLAPDRAYDVARLLEARLGEREEQQITVAELRELAALVLREREGDEAAQRFLDWEELDRLERPLIVTLGGAPGVGKSTLATLLAGRVGITRVIATDAIRNVIRAFFSHEFMPVVHYSCENSCEKNARMT